MKEILRILRILRHGVVLLERQLLLLFAEPALLLSQIAGAVQDAILLLPLLSKSVSLLHLCERERLSFSGGQARSSKTQTPAVKGDKIW